MKYFPLFILVGTPIFSYANQDTYESYAFLGLKGGYQIANDSNYHHQDPTSHLLGVFAGWQFSPEWSVDLGYQHWSTLKAKATGVEVDLSLLESALRYDWYLNSDTSLYGRAGLAYWSIDKYSPIRGELEARGYSPLVEVGVHYALSSNWSANLGYQYINNLGDSGTDYFDSHSVVVGMTYRFVNSNKSAHKKQVDPRPVIEEVTTAKPSAVVVMNEQDGSSLFATDSAQLATSAKARIQEVLSVLLRFPQANVIITGHTDAVGSEDYNKALSLRRANSVAQYLIGQGVLTHQVEVRAMGERQPIATNHTEAGRAQNRRVEIVIPEFSYQANQ